MLVMVSNNSKGLVHYLAGMYPGEVGHLYSPDGWRIAPNIGGRVYMPFALDNGAWTAFKNGREWDVVGFEKMCEDTARTGFRPLWVVVPDAVGDKAATLEKWTQWSPRMRQYKWPLAFAVQDGMVCEDVPSDADVVFVGGSTKWKRATLRQWAAQFPRVHVGRINTPEWLFKCVEAGVESVDGTGWFHERQMAQLEEFLRDGQKTGQQTLF